MELRQLRYFVAVADEGSISRAARRIFLTQPALSRQIRALEEEIGQCLVERQANSMRLTPAGEALRLEARDLLLHAEQMIERVRRVGQMVRLRVGYAPSLAAGMLSAAIGSFTRAHPGARVELSDLATQELLNGLNGNELDVVVTVGSERETRGLTWTPLVHVDWRLAIPRTHPFVRSQAIRPAEIAAEPLVVFCQRDYPEYWDLINDWFRSHGVRPRIAGEYDGVDSLLAAVAAGLGVAMVTTRTTARAPGGVRFRQLANAPAPLCIVAGHRTDAPEGEPLRAFIEELHRAAGSRRAGS